MIKALQPTMARIRYKRTTNRAANRCRCLFASTHTEREQVGGAVGRTRAFLETARASSKPCTEKLWSRKQRENRERSVLNQLGNALSSQREILSSSSSSSFYSS